MDTVAYEGGDAATAARLGGRHWERFAGAPGPDGHREIPYAGLIDLLNPVVALAAATADGTTAQYVGEEKFEDSTVEHYRVSTDAARYAAAQTQLGQTRREGLRAALAPGGSASLTLDLWLNDKDQLVRLQRTGVGDSGRAGRLGALHRARRPALGAGPGRVGHRGHRHPQHPADGPLSPSRRPRQGRFAPDGGVRLLWRKPKTAGCRAAPVRECVTEGSAPRARAARAGLFGASTSGSRASHVDPSSSSRAPCACAPGLICFSAEVLLRPVVRGANGRLSRSA